MMYMHCICCSTMGHVVSAQDSIHFYCATKYAVTALAEGVRQELREMKSNCRVTESKVTKYFKS